MVSPFVFFVLFGLVRSSPLVEKARVVGRDVDIGAAYDYVIVGGGASGLTVADRLTEDPKVSVLVIEYGAFDKKEDSVLVPGLLNLTSTPYWFDQYSIPQPTLNNRAFRVPGGKAVGGGTVINGMFFDRGGAEDYDNWEKLGNPGWGWNSLLPYFKKSETFTPPAKDFAAENGISWDLSLHGNNGPVQSSYPVYAWALIKKNFFTAFNGLGLPTPKDAAASGRKLGVFWGPSSLDPRDETRSYARTAHYDRVIKQRPNYHLIANTPVSKILFKGVENRAYAVEYLKSGSIPATVKAREEVILAAGAVHSPQILQLSGVGDKKLMQTLGIKSIVDLPGVGQNLQDHPTLFAAFNFSNIAIPNPDYLSANQTFAAEQLALYFSKRQGAYTITYQAGNAVAFLPLGRTAPPANLPPILASATAYSPPSTLPPSVAQGFSAQKSLLLAAYRSPTAPVTEIPWGGGAVIPIVLLKPLSRGTVLINSTSILAPPVYDYGALTAPSDLAILRAQLRLTRALVATPAMRELGPAVGPTVELAPGAAVASDDAIDAALRAQVVPSFQHPCCTNAMMRRGLGGVVGPDLKVHGTKGLRVVDASIFPLVPGTHLSATVYAVAEKAADIIKGGRKGGYK